MNKQALSAQIGAMMNALGFSANFSGAGMEAWRKQSANGYITISARYDEARALPGGQSRRASSLTTVVGCHFPPRAAGTLRLDSSSLMARAVVWPTALSSLMVGARLLAYKSAALLFDAAPWPPRLRGSGLGPSIEPIALPFYAHRGNLVLAHEACWLELCDLSQRRQIYGLR